MKFMAKVNVIVAITRSADCDCRGIKSAVEFLSLTFGTRNSRRERQREREREIEASESSLLCLHIPDSKIK